MEAAMSSITLPTRVQQPDIAGHLPALRAALEEQRQFRLDQLAQLTSQHTESSHHIDSLDASADNARVEVSAAVEAAARQALDDIEAALDRLDTGRYGACDRCHGSIPLERLFAIPQAPLCMHCQRRAEYRR
jgi:DnaK suppressor protein